MPKVLPALFVLAAISPLRAEPVFRESGGIVAIEVELIGKEGDTVVVLVNGRRYELKIDSLSDADQEFLKRWEPARP